MIHTKMEIFRNPISSCNLRFCCIITYLVEPQKVSPLSVGNSLKPCSLSVDFGKALQHESVGFRKLTFMCHTTKLQLSPFKQRQAHRPTIYTATMTTHAHPWSISGLTTFTFVVMATPEAQVRDSI